MVIGIPREIKKEEFRVGLTPEGSGHLKKQGHTILVESAAGDGSGFSDDEYLRMGADVVDREVLFQKADLIVKVKEPLPQEYNLFREGQALFTYLHLAPNPGLTRLLLDRRIAAFGYETLRKDGTLPLLAPMSEIAGSMAPLMGAYYLQKFRGGKGILPTGAVGVRPAKAVILGAGIVGTHAAKVCVGLGSETVVVNRGLDGLRRIDEMFKGRAKTLQLTEQNIAEEIRDTDIIIGALLVPGGKTPVVITREMVKTLQRGTVIIDVSVDQGGCVETSRPTTHGDPVYEVDGIIHYGVANMPGAYPRTSTLALTSATLPYVRLLADRGIEGALRDDPGLRSSLNTYKGSVAHKAVAESMGIQYKDIDEPSGP